MVGLCTEVFTSVLGGAPDQRGKLRDDVEVSADQLLDVASTPGEVTEAGLRSNISVGLQYLETWLQGTGAVGINNLMEDAATAEISRSQVWQWLHNSVRLPDGQVITADLVNRMIDEELAAIRRSRGDESFQEGGWDEAWSLFAATAISDDYIDFLTLPAYEKMP
jgi:malate synthase